MRACCGRTHYGATAWGWMLRGGARYEGECGRGSAGGGPNVLNSDSGGHHDKDDEKDTRARSWRGHCNPRRPPRQESGMSFIFSSTHVKA